jgi:hypothetical protein
MINGISSPLDYPSIYLLNQNWKTKRTKFNIAKTLQLRDLLTVHINHIIGMQIITMNSLHTIQTL